MDVAGAGACARYRTHELAVTTAVIGRVGLIALDYETFTVDADPGQTMFVFRAEPGSSDEHSLLLLAAIAAGKDTTVRSG